MGDPGGRRGTGQGDGWVCRGVVRRQEPRKGKAAGVEARVASGSHHQDLLGVVVQSGDAGRHADSEGEPGHTGGDTEEQEGNHKHALCLCFCVDIPVQKVCVRLCNWVRSDFDLWDNTSKSKKHNTVQ